MSGYGTTGNQAPTGTTGTHPVQGDPVAAQGGYLGKAQGWATRVTGNLQGQVGEMKGKLVGNQGSSGAAAGTGTGTGYHPTGTGTGYGATNTATGHSAPGNPPYSDANTGYNNSNTGFSNQTQPGHQTQPMSQGYATSQAKTGHATDGTYGSTAAKPSYTDQAKQYTAKGADMLHGGAGYLKGKLVGTQGTEAPGAATTGSGYSPGTGTGHGHVHRSGDPAMQTGAGGPQAKKSWTESAKHGLASGLTYTQQGLEVVKNKVGGPTGTPGTAGTGGASYSTGHTTTGTAGAQPGYSSGAQPGYSSGAQPGYSSGAQPGYNAGSQPGYNAGFQPGYNTGAEPGYNAGSQTGYNTSSQPSHSTGAQPGYNAGSQPGYSAGTNTNQKY